MLSKRKRGSAEEEEKRKCRGEELWRKREIVEEEEKRKCKGTEKVKGMV